MNRVCAAGQLNPIKQSLNKSAKQQCAMFLSEFSNEENALVNDPNAKTKDLGTLGE